MGQAWGPQGQGVGVCVYQLRFPIGIHPIGSWAQDHYLLPQRTLPCDSWTPQGWSSQMMLFSGTLNSYSGASQNLSTKYWLALSQLLWVAPRLWSA